MIEKKGTNSAIKVVKGQTIGSPIKIANLTQEQREKYVSKDDKSNLLKDIGLEEEAIAIYEAHIESTDRPHIEKLLRHIIDDEKHHISELKAQLTNLDKPLDEKQIKN